MSAKKKRPTFLPSAVVLDARSWSGWAITSNTPRFGFERASKYGVRRQWEGVADEAFMILVNDEGAIPAERGVVRYREDFNEPV